MCGHRRTDRQTVAVGTPPFTWPGWGRCVSRALSLCLPCAGAGLGSDRDAPSLPPAAAGRRPGNRQTNGGVQRDKKGMTNPPSASDQSGTGLDGYYGIGEPAHTHAPIQRAERGTTRTNSERIKRRQGQKTSGSNGYQEGKRKDEVATRMRSGRIKWRQG